MSPTSQSTHKKKSKIVDIAPHFQLYCRAELTQTAETRVRGHRNKPTHSTATDFQQRCQKHTGENVLSSMNVVCKLDTHT